MNSSAPPTEPERSAAGSPHAVEEKAGLWDLIREDHRTHGRNWSRPGFRAMAVYRFGAWREQLRNRIVRVPMTVVYLLLFRYVRNHYGIEIPATASIGRRLNIVHGDGIVFHRYATIGDDCKILHGVTIGAIAEVRPGSAPTLGNGVEVGTGAVILGPVSIGDQAKIGPNAVVMTDVPAGATVFVTPPRVMTPPGGGWFAKGGDAR